MPFWRVQATLIYPTAALRAAALARLPEGRSQDRDGAALAVDMGFGADEGQARALYARCRTERGAATGKASIHLCPHDGPPETWYPCNENPRARYEET